MDYNTCLNMNMEEITKTLDKIAYNEYSKAIALIKIAQYLEIISNKP